MSVIHTKPPAALYPCWDSGFFVHPSRWVDPFAMADGSERLVLTPAELRGKAERDRAYTHWLNRRGIKSKRCIFQVVQILESSNYEGIHNPWWSPWRDACVRVFVQPETIYDEFTKEHVQWYVLAPEDSELLYRIEMDRKGFPQPPRNAMEGERWVSKNPNLRRARLVPVECCKHLRHETSAGRLPVGL